MNFNTHYNRYDFAYVMNMMYSDYYGTVPDDAETYFRMAKAFIEDKDGKVLLLVQTYRYTSILRFFISAEFMTCIPTFLV